MHTRFSRISVNSMAKYPIEIKYTFRVSSHSTPPKPTRASTFPPFHTVQNLLGDTVMPNGAATSWNVCQPCFHGVQAFPPPPHPTHHTHTHTHTHKHRLRAASPCHPTHPPTAPTRKHKTHICSPAPLRAYSALRRYTRHGALSRTNPTVVRVSPLCRVNPSPTRTPFPPFNSLLQPHSVGTPSNSSILPCILAYLHT